MNNATWPPVYRPDDLIPRRRGLRWAVWAAAMVFTPMLAMAAYLPGFLVPANNLSDVTSASTARTNLGLGTIATAASNAYLLVANNLSDGTAATMRTNLGLGTAAVKASSAAGTTVASVTGSFTAGHIAAIADTAGTIQDGGVAPTGTVTSVTCGSGLTGGTFTGSGTCATGAEPTTIYTGTLPVTIATTMNLMEVIEMATPAAGVGNLPSTGLTDGLKVYIKDGLKNFNNNTFTVKTTDSSTIDKVAGATGYGMTQAGQLSCFKYAASGTNWYLC